MAKHRRRKNRKANAFPFIALLAGASFIALNKQATDFTKGLLINAGMLPQSKFSAVSSLVPIVASIAMLVAVTAGIFVLAKLSRKSRHRRRLLARAADSRFISTLGWREFEILVGHVFRKHGYRVEEGVGSHDGGIDLTLSKKGKRLLVQCKHWKATSVGVTAIRELAGVVQLNKADGGVLVCSGRFTNTAVKEARALGIKLISGAELAKHIHAIIESRN